MIQGRKLAIVATLATCAMVPSAKAQVVEFPQNLPGFNAAAGDPAIVIDFDSIASGTEITGQTIADVLFQAPGAPLIVVRGSDTFTPNGSPSHRLHPTTGENCLSPGGFALSLGPNPSVENDDLVLIFDPPVFAFGLDILEQSINGGVFVFMRVLDANNNELFFTGIPTPPGLNDPGGSHFYGVVSSESNIARIEFDETDSDSQNPDANIGYDSFRIGFAQLESPPSCDVAGPYTAECEGDWTSVQLDGSGSSDPDDDPLDYLWETDCPGGIFDDPTSATPLLTIDTGDGCTTTCSVTLWVDDGNGGTSECSTTVTIEDTTPPVVTCAVVSQDGLFVLIEYSAWDECGEVTGSAVIETRCCPLPVLDGQVVKMLCMNHEECKLNLGFADGTIKIITDEAALVVTATDECGNEATCRVELCVPD